MLKNRISVLAVLLGFASHLHAAGEIVPLKSVSTVSSRYGFSTQYVQIEARVANLSYDKQVFARVKRWDGQWVDVPMRFQRPADAGHEIWSTPRDDASLDPPLDQTWDPQFALRYVVNGQTFVADNNGQYYRQPADSGSVLYGAKVYAGTYYNPVLTSREGIVTGVLTTAGPAQPNDSVTIHYSTDGWVTTQRAVASAPTYFWAGSYSGAGNPNAFGSREWIYSLQTGNATRLDYAVQYINGGQEFWDNNYGRNYSSSIVPG